MTWPELPGMPRLDSAYACEDGNGTCRLQVHHWLGDETGQVAFADVPILGTADEVQPRLGLYTATPWQLLEQIREMSEEQREAMQDIGSPILMLLVRSCQNKWHPSDSSVSEPLAGMPRDERLWSGVFVRNGLGRLAVYPESVHVNADGIGTARLAESAGAQKADAEIPIIEGRTTLNEWLLTRQQGETYEDARIGAVQSLVGILGVVVHLAPWRVPHPDGVGDTVERLVHTDGLQDYS